jgi:alpha 1,2-mannosyltransferase
VALLCLILFFAYNRDALSDIRSDFMSEQIPTNLQKLEDQAHKLPSADSYRAHFSAVTRLKGITLAEAKETCHWPEGEFVDFQFDKNDDWVVTDRPNEEIEFRRKAWQDYILSGKMIPWEKVKNRFEGRGLVVLAGNHDTKMRLKVSLRRLKKIGSTIPVEVHYWDDEMNEENLEEFASLYQPISFNDLSKPHNILPTKKDNFMINFQLKTASLVNSKFAEPLLLDSDNIPILDPTILWDSRVYREYGTVFWPDIARTWPQNPAWSITNTPCRMGEYELESGQLMVDKRRYWYHLQLAAWMNNDQGKYYDAILLGDKDTFRFAWHALKTDYGRPKKWLTSVGTENEGYYCGNSFAQHHPDDGRVAFLHGGAIKSVSLEVLRWNKEEKGGNFRHYKQALFDEDPTKNIHVSIVWDNAAYKPDHTEDFRTAMCVDMKDLKVGDTEDILPGWEKEFESLGGYWMLDKEVKDKADKAKAEKAKADKAKAGAA